ncbi:hypothetical protein QSU93_03950 [Limosilactobacillus fermentum]|nr:hypothetical protein [Limosilactobacillus fermentum]MBM9560376.1 hypothetical protein [Limosilactobacillus fermentum]WJD85752.1 hypothetical protein QSU93_03950 [Limosilactobacillus fermentum]
MTVVFVDETTGKTIDTAKITGKYTDQITYSTADEIAKLTAQGYELVKDGFDQTGQTLGQDNDGQIYTVILKHRQVGPTM